MVEGPPPPGPSGFPLMSSTLSWPRYSPSNLSTTLSFLSPQAIHAFAEQGCFSHEPKSDEMRPVLKGKLPSILLHSPSQFIHPASHQILLDPDVLDAKHHNPPEQLQRFMKHFPGPRSSECSGSNGQINKSLQSSVVAIFTVGGPREARRNNLLWRHGRPPDELSLG